jgi:hypothetical protein
VCTNDQNCVGQTPQIVGNVTVLGILQNGSNVNHHYGAVEGPTTPNKPSNNAAPKPTAAPDGPPLIL